MDLGFLFPKQSNHILRLGTLGIAIGLSVMGVDAGVAHFAGRPMKSMAQLTPVLFGQLACGALILGALLRWQDHRLRKLLRVVGALSILVGVAGTFGHGIGMFKALAEMEANLGAVLAAASPMVGSFAFMGMGGLLVFLGNPKTGRALRNVFDSDDEAPAAPAKDGAAASAAKDG